MAIVAIIAYGEDDILRLIREVDVHLVGSNVVRHAGDIFNGSARRGYSCQHLTWSTALFRKRRTENGERIASGKSFEPS